MSKLAFKKPSGESRLTELAKKEILQGEVQRFNLDLPKQLAVKLKIEAAKQSKTMREIVIEAITQIIK
jgi:predicted HicB family RNase H-like nuclease